MDNSMIDISATMLTWHLHVFFFIQ